MYINTDVRHQKNKQTRIKTRSASAALYAKQKPNSNFINLLCYFMIYVLLRKTKSFRKILYQYMINMILSFRIDY